MKVIRRINHNAALALDGQGREVVVLGKGIGFPQVPYQLDDLSKISRTFYDLDPRYVDMIASLPQSMLLASADIVEQAEINLDGELNPNVTLTLADHLNFAVQRLKKGLVFQAPLACDVAQLYPREYELGQLALDIVQDYAGVRLPDEEIVNIAMHLINAEVENSDLHAVMQMIQIQSDVDRIIEQELGVRLDRKNFQYSRFSMHLRYLVQRFTSGEQLPASLGGFLADLAAQYPQVYRCALRIAGYFEEAWQWKCSQDELLYLMLHINRLCEKQG